MKKGGIELLARSFLTMALRHPECREGELVSLDHGSARLRLTMNVEMPLDMKVEGVSPIGVRRTEPVDVFLPEDYPWSPPKFTLREDFPRDLPHLQPDAVDKPPHPCLLDGSPEEFFAQFGLAEAGAFHLVEQLALWLRRAAVGCLIDPAQGWEPTIRRDIADTLSFDSHYVRGLVDRNGGWAVLDSKFVRQGALTGGLNADVQTWLMAGSKQVPLRNSPQDEQFAALRRAENLVVGSGVVAVVWADKLPDGTPRVAARYFPETVRTLGDLRQRAGELGCERGLNGFIASLERAFSNMTHPAPVPVGIILCARRPFNLIGAMSPIELIPYVIEIRATAKRTSLFASGDNEPVAPAAHRESVTRALLRSVSGSTEHAPIALLGCGSVGSKVGLHLARSGQILGTLSDSGWLQPHNMARHGLSASHLPTNKAEALAIELRLLDQNPTVHDGNLARTLRDPKALRAIIPSVVKAVINTTASLTVRESLAAASGTTKARLFETALFGRGRGAYVLAAGKGNNPTPSDLMAELYATLDDAETSKLMFDPEEGLARIQVGQGCGSLSMRMTDARLSAMSAAVTEVIIGCIDEPKPVGAIYVATSTPKLPTTVWSRKEVPPFLQIEITGGDGWVLRLSPRIAELIRQEAAEWPAVETGGIILGVASARLKVVTVVDVLPAPIDSQRSAEYFLLGTAGLQAAIEARHESSGQTLFDIGTWHSHLSDQGPSPTDWATAAKLTAERAPPSVLMIVTPRRFLAIMALGGENG